MKLIIIFIFTLLLPRLSSAQNTLWIDFEDNSSIYYTDYHVYKNNSLIYKDCYSEKNDKTGNIDTLFNLKDGNYIVKYNTLFGLDSTQVNLNNKEKDVFLNLSYDKIDNSRISETKSLIEHLKNNESIKIDYNLGGCFISKNESIIIKKLNDKYYKIKDKRKKRLSHKKINKIIWYEKVIRNINIKSNLHNQQTISTCGESVTFTKNETIIFTKNINCGVWNDFNLIEKLIR